MVWCVKVKVFSLENGSELNSEADLRDDVFGLPYDNKFMSMYFARMKSASYVPTNKTKNISEVSGTTKKPFKQKHTGNARQGSMRSAQMRGGGIAFGPRAMQGFIKIPKGEAILAKSMLLSNAFANGRGFVIDKAHFNSCRTKEAKKVLSKFSPKSVVIIHNGGVDANSLLAVRNLQGVKFVSQNMLTASDLAYANAVLIDVNAVDTLSKVLYVDYEGDNN